MPKLVLVRHGQSMGQLDRAAYKNDSTNFLSEEGAQQAHECGELLHQAGFIPNHIFCSTYTRARQTARMVQYAMGLNNSSISFHDQLRERQHYDYGYGTQIEDYADIVTRVSPVIKHGVIPKLEEGHDVMVVGHYHLFEALWMLIGHESWLPAERKMPYFRNAWPYFFIYNDDNEFVAETDISEFNPTPRCI